MISVNQGIGTFVPEKLEKGGRGGGGGHKMFLAKGGTFVWGLEKFKGG